MKKEMFWITLLFVISTSFVAGASLSIDPLKTLVGNWEGVAKWSGARTGEQKMDASYSLTGHGTAVVENLIVDGQTSMTSVYHTDGNSLRMTHFCAAGNQPRLIATESADPQTFSFKFVDATNLASPDAPHVTGLALTIRSADDLTLIFTFSGNGKTSFETITMHRIH